MGATAYLYSCGSFIHLNALPERISALITLDVNIIILDAIQIRSAIHLRHFFSSLNKKFEPRSNPDPNPFIIVSNKPDHEFSNSSKSFTTLLFNSSIWVRYINIAKSNEELIEPIRNITIAIKQASDGKSYENINSTEYIDFHLRNQAANYLQGSGHADYVTPNVYSNELHRKTDTTIAKDLNFFFDDNKENFDYKTKGIVLRILLIDDKTSCIISEDGIENPFECKAFIIKRLLELKFDKVKHKDVSWRTQKKEDALTIYQTGCGGSCNGCFKREFGGTKDLIKKIKDTQDRIQIIAVKNLKTARQILACEEIRVDLIMMDYLLDWKNDKPEEREYATEFWGDGIEKYFEFSTDAKKEGSKYADKVKIYDQIKSNRGPMQRLWIFPITAFNQTFIDDLRNKGVRLIDHYWYLSRGADPINTPYLFINSLNKFLQLQLQQAIFSMDMLLGFLSRSVEALEGIKDPEDFQAFMGAEYTVLMQKFGWRPVIYRDKKAGSLFAKYVWDNFYSRKSNRILFRLLDLIQKFYQTCAYGEINDAKEMRNNLTELKVYIIDEQENIRKRLIEEQGKSELNVAGLNAFMKKINLIKPR